MDGLKKKNINTIKMNVYTDFEFLSKMWHEQKTIQWLQK